MPSLTEEEVEAKLKEYSSDVNYADILYFLIQKDNHKSLPKESALPTGSSVN